MNDLKDLMGDFLDDDDYIGNISTNYEFNSNITDYWSNGVFGSKVHLAKGILSLAAIVPNLFLICLVLSKRFLWNKLNFLIANLSFCQLLLCSIYAIYSFVKFSDSYAPVIKVRCLVLTWFFVIISFSPTWAVTFLLFSRITHNLGSKQLNDKIFSLRNLFVIRILILCIDAILTSLIVAYDVSPLAAPTHCTYNYMLDHSKIYLFYNFVLAVLIIGSGAGTLISRFYLRFKMFAPPADPQQTATPKGIVAGADFATRLRLARQAFKKRSTIVVVAPANANDSERSENGVPPQPVAKPPSAIWLKPKYLLLFVIVAVLFLVPRAAFLAWRVKHFWLVASICTILLSMIIPILFLTLISSLRDAWSEMFRMWAKRKDKISPLETQNEKIVSNFAAPAESFKEIVV